MKKKIFLIILVLSVVIYLGILVYIRPFEGEENIQKARPVVTEETIHKEKEETATEFAPKETKKPERVEKIIIPGLKVRRVNVKCIVIQWADDRDSLVKNYIIQKYDNRIKNGDNAWVTVGKVSTETHTKGKVYKYTDKLKSSEPQQYVYRVVPSFRDNEAYVAADDYGVLCSNIKICIDPGHYAGKNAVTGLNSFGYAEGNFTLDIAKEMKKLLETKYGVAVCMTRDSGSISLGGYRDEALDSGHISLRGKYAAEQGCDLFVSIHTNANEDNANGTGTFEQPISIDKPILVINDPVLVSDTLLAVCNDVGKKLAKISYQLGISSHKNFTVVSGNDVMEWTITYNDSTDRQGTVVCRHGSHGQYYGVLRGAEEAGIPGIIIEHGYHTVPQMRDAAINGKLKFKWAEADAKGIASGFDFQKQTDKE